MENITLDEGRESDESMLYEPLAKLTKVPPEFDCDSGDGHNVITASEYVVDICKYWRELELQTPIRANPLQNRAEGTSTECLL